MRADPIEFAAATTSRTTRRVGRVVPPAKRAVLDEAFADYLPAGIAAAHPTSANERTGLTKELIADISAQLETLDHQRRQLSRLLEQAESAT